MWTVIINIHRHAHIREVIGPIKNVKQVGWIKQVKLALFIITIFKTEMLYFFYNLRSS